MLEIVAESEQNLDDDSGASTDITAADSRGYAAVMPIVAEESETEYPSFDRKRKNPDTQFEDVIDKVLAENREENHFRRDDLSDDDDDDRGAAAQGNPLQDLTFAGIDIPLVPKNRPAKKLDNISAIRDYLEQELG